MRFLRVLFLIFLASFAVAQSPYEFYYNNALAEDDARPPDVDNELFIRQLGGDGSVFERLSEFNFSFTRWSRRGYERWMNDRRWGLTRMGGIVSYSPDYQLFSTLRQGQTRESFAGDARSLVREGRRVQGLFFNRKGRGGVRASRGGEIAAIDAYAGVSASHRAGRDPLVGGVFMDETSLLGAVDHGDFSLAVAALRSENGLRSYATKEAFRLTGDPFYNPSWGFYDDKERSARTVNNLSINTLATWSRTFDATLVNVSAAYRAARQKREGLTWFEAATPYPDYYRYMPDYQEINSADGWLVSDPRVTQIFWENLVEQNLNRPDQAAYIVENRVEDTADFQLFAQGKSTLADGLSITYSLGYQQDRRTRYKQVEDLLGAQPFGDVNRFLTDDEVFGTQHLNDARNPDRLIGEGDHFGYSYLIVAEDFTARIGAEYFKSAWRFSAALSTGSRTLRRTGFYEKQTLPGALSLGKSRSYLFNPWSLEAAVGRSFSARHFVDLRFKRVEIPPFADNIFLNPDYSNISVDRPQKVKISSAEVDYAAVWERSGLTITGFWTRTGNETAVYRYWDDIAETYSQMAENQIVKLFYGVEVGGELELGPRFSISGAFTAGNYTYSADTQVIIIDDTTREPVAAGVRARMKKYHLATAPQQAATLELEYNSWGWIASLSASYAGGRWVAPTPLRRMERVYRLATSEEQHDEFTGQEKLENIFTLNLFILNSFNLSKGRFTTTVSVNNLLGKSSVYHGYEQMRVRRTDAVGGWRPFESKYLNNYGRTYYVSATYTF